MSFAPYSPAAFAVSADTQYLVRFVVPHGACQGCCACAKGANTTRKAPANRTKRVLRGRVNSGLCVKGHTPIGSPPFTSFTPAQSGRNQGLRTRFTVAAIRDPSAASPTLDRTAAMTTPIAFGPS